jgi:predicted Ser/Thr protein kinase
MQSVRKVHTLGITQNMALELHHFVMKDGKVFLIDFSQALAHRCNNAMPLFIDQRFCLNREDVRESDEHNCGELMTIAKQSLRAAAVRC